MEMISKKRNIIMVPKIIKMYSDIRSMTFKRNCLNKVKQQIPINITQHLLQIDYTISKKFEKKPQNKMFYCSNKVLPILQEGLSS